MSRRVVVIGGGLAGITAALYSGDDGAEVTLLESKPKLGGLTHSFRRGDLSVDNGQHVFLRCCTSYLRLLERLGVRDRVTLQPRLRIAVRTPGSERMTVLTRNNLPAPLHLGASLLRYAVLSPADRVRAAGTVAALRRIDLNDPTVDEVNFGSWLTRHGQNERIVSALWDLFTIATLNLHSADASLALAAKVFQTGLFTDASAGDIGWSRVPLGELHGSASLHTLVASGVLVRTNAAVRSIARDGDGWVVTERNGTVHGADQVVVATPPDVTEALLPAHSIDIESGWSRRLGSSPIVNVHFRFDRAVLDEPFVAGVRTPVQWVFDRSSQADLPSGHYLALSLSAADDLIDMPTADIRAHIEPALRALLPATAAARVEDFFVTRERHATFRGVPGTARSRPSQATRRVGLALAGAWTATGWPATMESAVLSGEAAANVLNAQAHSVSATDRTRPDRRSIGPVAV